MAQLTIPRNSQPLVGPERLTSTEWFRYFAGLTTIEAATAAAQALADAAEADAIVAAGALADAAEADAIAQAATTRREKLSANRAYYVRTDGSDTNDGLANTAGGAFLTLQKAADIVHDTIDLAGYIVAINIAVGTYTGGVIVNGPFVGSKGPGSVIFVGAVITTVIISTTSAHCFSAQYGAQFSLSTLEMRTATFGNCVNAGYNGEIDLVGSVRFGACASSHVEVLKGGGFLCAGVNYTISGGAGAHIHVPGQAWIVVTVCTVTLSGTPAFSNFFAGVTMGTIEAVAVTFSGAATGPRYLSHNNGYINTNGGGANYFPGSIAGSTATGGIYA